MEEISLDKRDNLKRDNRAQNKNKAEAESILLWPDEHSFRRHKL
jgi:hypothetical protein